MNLIRKIAALITASLLLSAAGCRGGSSSGSEDSIAETSSVNAENEMGLDEQRFPDTIYLSAKENVKFEVSILDTLSSGIINSLKDLYASTPGAFTFRKGSRRQANFGGKVDSIPSEFVIDWEFHTKENFTETKYGKWGGGTGWTGEPVLVEWPDTLLSKMKSAGVVYDEFSGKEIILGSLCGYVYFLDYLTGKPSRNAIEGVNPIKGSVSLDPTLNGNLYVGQGVPIERPFGVFKINLFTNKIDFFLPEDPKAQRKWGAFDSSSIRVGQFQFFPGENGSIYKYLVKGSDLKLHSVLRYTVNGAAPGIESSMAVYGNYGFTADNHGNILGINLDRLEPVWHYRLGDDTDSTPVVVEEDGRPYVYAGCEIDRQGNEGFANLAKLDAATGEEIWTAKIPGHAIVTPSGKRFDGGFFSTLLPGTGNCSDRIYTVVVKNQSNQNGNFLAIDRKTGNILYEIPLKYYGWSSPVGFMTPDNRMLVVAADCGGRLYLIDGEKGELITSALIGANFESSPVVSGNSLVMGSRGNTIYKISLK